MKEEGFKESAQSMDLSMEPQPSEVREKALQNLNLQSLDDFLDFYKYHLRPAFNNRYEELLKEFRQLDSDKKINVLKNIDHVLNTSLIFTDEGKLLYGISYYKQFLKKLKDTQRDLSLQQVTIKKEQKCQKIKKFVKLYLNPVKGKIILLIGSSLVFAGQVLKVQNWETINIVGQVGSGIVFFCSFGGICYDTYKKCREGRQIRGGNAQTDAQ